MKILCDIPYKDDAESVLNSLKILFHDNIEEIVNSFKYGSNGECGWKKICDHIDIKGKIYDTKCEYPTRLEDNLRNYLKSEKSFNYPFYSYEEDTILRT